MNAAEADRSLSYYGRRLWESCRNIDADSPAGKYLLARCCVLPDPAGHLRWHQALKHPSGYVGPALVGLVTDAMDASKWMTLHRTWIRPDGKKADVDPPRMLLADHRKSGGVIRMSLRTDDIILVVAEGIETALTPGFDIPVWACIDAGNLGALPVIGWAEMLWVAVDNDPAGNKAFERVRDRWLEAGRDVLGRRAPVAGMDLNDWAMAGHDNWEDCDG